MKQIVMDIKFFRKAFCLFSLICIGFLLTSQHPSENLLLFEKAKFTMETKGDLQGAINLFEEIIEEYPEEKEIAAKSQLYIGLCYEKLGLNLAAKAYQLVIDNYPGQADVVKKARDKLTALQRGRLAGDSNRKNFRISMVWQGSDMDDSGEISPDGKYLSFVDWDTGDLAIREMSTGKKRKLTDKGSWEESGESADASVWSPDSKQLAYA
jgi:tetratricopeptide (TPR) repeat protein